MSVGTAPVAYILGAETCTALGIDLSATVIERLAGTSPFEEVPVLLDQEGVGVRAARLNLLTAGAGRWRRMTDLAVTALAGLVPALEAAGSLEIPLFLGLPQRDELASDAPARLLGKLREVAAPLKLILPPGGFYEFDRASALIALRDAIAATMTSPGGVLLGGVDCLCDTNSLVAAAMNGRLLGRSNVDGIIPGEGAGFLWLGAEPQGRGQARTFSRVTAHACSDVGLTEPEDGVGRAAVLSRVWSQLRHAALDGARVDQLLYCQPSQARWATPLAWAMLRNTTLCPEPFAPSWLAESMGDLGAAAGAVALALAAAPHGEPGTHQRTLLLALSDDSRGGACLIDASRRDHIVQPNAVALPTPLQGLRAHADITAFEAERCADHLEELGVLLSLRSRAVSESEHGWRDAEGFEERITTRQRALAQYPQSATSKVQAALAGTDEEMALGAVLIASRTARGPGLESMLDILRAQPPDELDRWLDAAIWGGRWSLAALQQYAALLDRGDLLLASELLDGCCQADAGRLLQALARLEPGTDDHDRILLCLARWGGPGTVAETQFAKLTMRGPSLEAALWAGYLGPLDTLSSYVRHGHEFARSLTPYLAALGRADDARAIAARDGAALTSEEISALGRIGLAQTVPTLLAAFTACEDLERRRSISRALEQICGPEHPSEIEDEAEAGERDADWWEHWWRLHGSRFHPNTCYRRGRPSQTLVLIDELLDPQLSSNDRRAVLLDLRARAGLRISLGVRWPVREQLDVITRARALLLEAPR